MTTECGICRRAYTPPVKTLTCGHSFCLTCLIYSGRTQAQPQQNINWEVLMHNPDLPIPQPEVRFACPTCRVVTVLPGGRLRNLPTNFAFQNVVESGGNAQSNATNITVTRLENNQQPSVTSDNLQQKDVDEFDATPRRSARENDDEFDVTPNVEVTENETVSTQPKTVNPTASDVILVEQRPTNTETLTQRQQIQTPNTEAESGSEKIAAGFRAIALTRSMQARRSSGTNSAQHRQPNHNPQPTESAPARTSYVETTPVETNIAAMQTRLHLPQAQSQNDLNPRSAETALPNQQSRPPVKRSENPYITETSSERTQLSLPRTIREEMPVAKQPAKSVHEETDVVKQPSKSAPRQNVIQNNENSLATERSSRRISWQTANGYDNVSSRSTNSLSSRDDDSQTDRRSERSQRLENSRSPVSEKSCCSICEPISEKSCCSICEDDRSKQSPRPSPFSRGCDLCYEYPSLKSETSPSASSREERLSKSRSSNKSQRNRSSRSDRKSIKSPGSSRSENSWSQRTLSLMSDRSQRSPSSRSENSPNEMIEYR